MKRENLNWFKNEPSPKGGGFLFVFNLESATVIKSSDFVWRVCRLPNKFQTG